MRFFNRWLAATQGPGQEPQEQTGQSVTLTQTQLNSESSQTKCISSRLALCMSQVNKHSSTGRAATFLNFN